MTFIGLVSIEPIARLRDSHRDRRAHAQQMARLDMGGVPGVDTGAGIPGGSGLQCNRVFAEAPGML
ncbi:hypothetical protein D3C78_1322570 [compost metagenome]